MSERLTASERQRMRAMEARAAAKHVVPSGRDLPTEKLPGLYDPRNEHDSCGVGFVADLKGQRSHDIIAKGLQILENLTHRGAVGAAQAAEGRDAGRGRSRSCHWSSSPSP